MGSFCPTKWNLIMTREQNKAHWWIVENHPDFRVTPPKKYFEICDIVFNALNQGQTLPIDSVVGRSEQLHECSHRSGEECIKPSNCSAFGCNKPM